VVSGCQAGNSRTEQGLYGRQATLAGRQIRRSPEIDTPGPGLQFCIGGSAARRQLVTMRKNDQAAGFVFPTLACSPNMRDRTRDDYEARIWRVQRHIQDHLGKPLPLEQLAAVASFSPFHFHRLFRAMVGESVQEYVSRLRLELSASALVNTQRPIVDIAFAAGYEAHESFTRAFRRRFGASPKSYRESRGALGQPFELPVTGPHLHPPERNHPVNVEIRNLPARRVAFVRHVGPYQDCGQAWARLCSSPRVARFFGPKLQMFGICYDDLTSPTPPGSYDACLVVDGRLCPRRRRRRTSPAARQHLHVGPYENLHATHRRLYGEWLPSSGRSSLGAEPRGHRRPEDDPTWACTEVRVRCSEQTADTHQTRCPPPLAGAVEPRPRPRPSAPTSAGHSLNNSPPNCRRPGSPSPSPPAAAPRTRRA
jgi:AraC family transcriptional regulator